MEQFYYQGTAVVENADADCHSLLQYLAQSAQKDPQSVLIVSTKAAVPDVVRRPFSDRRERIWNSFIIKVLPW